ncbi:hypothetical protein GCM10009834_46500 [Streptomonospora arabica]|uniref:Uncharacterized protein n=1 Tax=Streptomonospora halophila TaxID=427369 RepID=A0ABP9GGX2_9ACTN
MVPGVWGAPAVVTTTVGWRGSSAADTDGPFRWGRLLWCVGSGLLGAVRGEAGHRPPRGGVPKAGKVRWSVSDRAVAVTSGYAPSPRA